ncbi:MAG: DUF2235 domain-containing protein [Acetobacteraceae bacterium]|nr:DUF2235 domain-containing protein [Acetobacteraceae bacterium]
MPKRIVLCFDGTWNAPAEKFVGLKALHDRAKALCDAGGKPAVLQALEALDPGPDAVETNVCRFYRSIVARQPEKDGAGPVGQVRWYDAGVGTNWYDRVAGGAFGLGLSQNLREGYQYLAETCEPGDSIFILGFSRGAYTARSLVGMIRNSGLLPAGGTGDGPQSAPMMEAYEIYRTRDRDADSERALAFRKLHGCRMVEIAFLGVWDTVGALGIPIESFAGFNRSAFEFHDTELSGIVRNAFHAIAVDEHREPYAVTLWDPIRKLDQRVEQRWFVGAHCDVGGGYQDRGLSDVTLAWMQRCAMECGLELHPGAVPAVGEAQALGALTDSFANFLEGLFRLFSRRFYRPVRRAQFGQEQVDETVHLRLKRDVAYRPKNPGLFDG